jgi:hypothetical protein
MIIHYFSKNLLIKNFLKSTENYKFSWIDEKIFWSNFYMRETPYQKKFQIINWNDLDFFIGDFLA